MRAAPISDALSDALWPPPLRVGFRVAGTPAGQGRLSCARGGRAYYSNWKALAPWRDALAKAARWAMAGRPPISGPVIVGPMFTLRRAKGCKDPLPITRGGYGADLDHLQRALGDALTIGGCLTDDAVIVDWNASKRYVGLHGGMEFPGVEVLVTEVAL